jgi:hypothetical protein
MGRQGQRYIKENFGWEKLLLKYELAFRSSARPPRPKFRSKGEKAEEDRAEKAEALLATEATAQEESVAIPRTPTEDGERSHEQPRDGGFETPESKPLPMETPPGDEMAESGKLEVSEQAEEPLKKEEPQSMEAPQAETESKPTGEPMATEAHRESKKPIAIEETKEEE